MSKEKNYNIQYNSDTKPIFKTVAFWILLSVLLLSVISSCLTFWIVDNIRIAGPAGNYVNNGDDSITFLSDPAEPSDLPEIISEPFTIGSGGLQADTGSDLSPFNMEVVPLAGPTDFGLVTATDPTSISTGGGFEFLINGQRSQNYSTTVQINLNSNTGFKLEMEKSFFNHEDGEGEIYRDYYIYISVGGVWYRTPQQAFYDGWLGGVMAAPYNFDSATTGEYKVCVVLQYGLGSAANVQSKHRTDIYTIVYNPINTVPLPNAPAKEGYTFVGWYFDEALTQPVTALEIVENTTLYAKYTINRHTVSFTTNGGSTINGITVDWGTTVNLDTYISTRTGYDFKGWFTNEGLTTPAAASLLVKSDYNLFASWEIRKINITLMVDGELWQVITVDYCTGVSAIVTEIEQSIFSVKSFTTEGVVYNGVSEQAEFLSDSVFTLETKAFSEQWKAFDWWNFAMWVGIGLGGLALVVLVVFSIYRSKKNRIAEAQSAAQSAAKKTGKSKGGK